MVRVRVEMLEVAKVPVMPVNALDTFNVSLAWLPCRVRMEPSATVNAPVKVEVAVGMTKVTLPVVL